MNRLLQGGVSEVDVPSFSRGDHRNAHLHCGFVIDKPLSITGISRRVPLACHLWETPKTRSTKRVKTRSPALTQTFSISIPTFSRSKFCTGTTSVEAVSAHIMAASIFSSVFLMVPPRVGGLLQQDEGHCESELLLSCSHNSSSSFSLLLVPVYITAGFRITKHLWPPPWKTLPLHNWHVWNGGSTKGEWIHSRVFITLSAKIWLQFLIFIENAATVCGILHSAAACCSNSYSTLFLKLKRHKIHFLHYKKPQKKTAVGKKRKLYIEWRLKSCGLHTQASNSLCQQTRQAPACGQLVM